VGALTGIEAQVLSQIEQEACFVTRRLVGNIWLPLVASVASNDVGLLLIAIMLIRLDLHQNKRGASLLLNVLLLLQDDLSNL